MHGVGAKIAGTGRSARIGHFFEKEMTARRKFDLDKMKQLQNEQYDLFATWNAQLLIVAYVHEATVFPLMAE